MSKTLIVTWPGGGNQPPAIGLAQRLRGRGHEVVFAGYPHQVDRFTELGFKLAVMPGASRSWDQFDPDDMAGFLLDQVWACPDHPTDVSAVVEQESPDLIVVDCMLGAALAAVENVGVPTAVLVHSAPGILCPPGGGAELTALNAVRARLGRDQLDTFRAAWERHEVLCATIPELDPHAAEAPTSFRWVGPIFEETPAGAYAPEEDHRPLVLAASPAGRPGTRPAGSSARSTGWPGPAYACSRPPARWTPPRCTSRMTTPSRCCPTRHTARCCRSPPPW